MSSVPSWLPSIVTVVTVVVTALTPQIQSFLSTHPIASVVVAGLYAIFTHILPSPVAQKEE